MSREETNSAAKATIEALVEVDAPTQAMIEAGVFYGRTKRKTNPRMKSWIAGNRNGVEIVDLAKTKSALDEALIFLKEKAQEGAPMLLVATQPAAQEDAMKFAQEFEIPFASTRWLGGTLTNFRVISKRIEYFKKLKSDLATGALQKYTKKEQLMMQKELGRLSELLGTLESLGRLPTVVILIDSNLHLTAVKETRTLNIPVVGFINTDSDPDLVRYPIVGNNKAKTSIHWFLEQVANAIREGKKEMVPAAVVAPTEQK